jgi:DNA-binding PadR family transcriptional regulator
LGLLIERPGYGYDIQLRFHERFRFLSRSEKVTYKVIDQLQDEGWIERVGIKHAGQTERGAPRVIYGETASGREEFSRWIAEPCEIGIATVGLWRRGLDLDQMRDGRLSPTRSELADLVLQRQVRLGQAFVLA